MNKIFINGADYTSDAVEGLDEITIELGLNQETKTIGKVLSSDIAGHYYHAVFEVHGPAMAVSYPSVI